LETGNLNLIAYETHLETLPDSVDLEYP